MSFAALIAQVDRAAQSALGGEFVTYASTVGPPVPVIGIFDEEFVLANGDAQAGVEASGPAVFFRLEDLPMDPEDDEPTLTIRGVNYRVIERRADGLGGIVLAVRRVILEATGASSALWFDRDPFSASWFDRDPF